MATPLVGTFLVSLITYVLPILLTSLLLFYGYLLLLKKQFRKSKRPTSPFPRPEQIGAADPDDGQSGEGEDTGPPSHDDENIPFVPYKLSRRSFEDMVQRSKKFYELMNNRRTVRYFSKDPVPLEVVENAIKTAGTAPSGAHTEPWTYALISNQELKERIREIVEAEEELNYTKRMGAEWVQDLKKFRTTSNKPYLTEAPYLVIVFKQTHSFDEKNRRREHYYHEISTSLSVGILLSALTNVGLVTLTSTPMNAGPAIRQLLGRPSNEKVLLLLPVGFPSDDCQVPDLKRKSLDKIMITYD